MTIEEILAAMQAIIDTADGRSLTAEEVANYEGFEAQLADAQASDGVRRRQAAYATPVPGSGPAPRAEVREPSPYNMRRVVTPQGPRHIFALGHQGHDLSTDMFAMINGGSDAGNAADRVNGFIREQMARIEVRNDLDQADFNELTPNRYRPDLWQPQMDYDTPLWDMVNSGTTDGVPFDVPKFNSASGLVGPATEGTEPAPGAMVLTGQTITPTQVWGKVEITRQQARKPSNPSFSGIIWDQMLREYYEEREQAVATFLNTLTAATDITVTGSPAVPTNDNDQTTVQSLEAALVSLLFARGGNRFRAFAVHEALYKVLARVTDDAGRALYPAIGATNANGTVTALWRTLNINGTLAVPAWALGAAGGNASVNSWLFDPAKVRAWASTPERLDWNFGATVQTANIPQLSYVTVGIYGDLAFANLDINGVRQVIFDQNTAA